MSRDGRAALDARIQAALARPRAIVYTDTADFTLRAARDGILHFMMVFDRALRSLAEAAARHRGRVVKVEADSLLLSFPDTERACLGVEAMERALRRTNRGRTADERLRFSYGIGFGEVLDLEEDLFGLEVNLASKLGEDLAHPGEALLTPSAAEALPPATRRRLVSHGVVNYGGRPLTVRGLRLSR
jgi:adenylate cyclase